MPRRPPKSKWQPGVSGNPNGRPIGSTNQINNEIRDAFAMLLQSQIPNLQDWLDRAAKKDPIKALDLFTKISERFIPALSRQEITGAEGLPFSPITINLPNIPKISLGEGSPTSLLTSPAEEVKELGEGTPTESPMFLPDKEVMFVPGEGTPAEESGKIWVGAPSQDLKDPGDGGLD